MKKVTAILFVLAMTAGNPAYAAESDLLTLGIGTSVGVNRTTSLGATTESSFNSDVSLRLKALNFLAVDFSFSPTEKVDTAELVFDGNYRMSALIYLLPLDPVAAFIKAGVGAGSFGELFDIAGASSSYHGGFGLDIDITDNLVIGGEFLFLVPGVASIKNVIAGHANDEVARIQDPRRHSEPAAATPEISDFLSTDNFRVAVGARYYF